MSRRTIALSIALSWLAASPTSWSQEESVPLEQLRQWASEVSAEVSELRGHAFERAVDVRWMAPAAFREYALKRFEETSSRAEVDLQSRVLQRLGLAPVGTDLFGSLLGLLEEQAGGFYDPPSGTFYLLEGFEISEPVVRLLMAHELTHALDDQLHDLDAMIAAVAGEDDRSFAVQCLLEGSATHIMGAWMLRAMAAKRIRLKDLLAFQKAEQARFASFEKSPVFLQWSLIGPYLAGTLYLKRGKAMKTDVPADDYARAFADVPLSSEQILHPEKYWDERTRDIPSHIALRIPTSWEVAYENTLGEFGTAVLFKGEKGRFTMLRMTGMSLGLKGWRHPAASGWDGDRYYLLRRGAHEAVAWASVWDDEAEAEEFVRALVAHFDGIAERGYALVRRGASVLLVLAERDAACLGSELMAGLELEVR